MRTESIPSIVAIVIQSTLALTVFFANPHRKSNQCFLLVSLSAIFWLASLYVGSNTDSSRTLAICIRASFIFGVAVVAMLDVLRLCIRDPHRSWLGIIRRITPTLLVAICVCGLCLTSWFLTGAAIRRVGDHLQSEPQYGPGVYIFAAYFAFAIGALIVRSIRDLRRAAPAQKAELGFVLIGALAMLAFSLAVYQILRFFIPASRLLLFAPFRVVLFSGIMAYGIATTKVMEVGLLFRRTMSYLIVSFYLLALYFTVWWLVSAVTASVLIDHHTTVAHVIAALVVAFAMAPAKGISQRFADRLFVGTRGLDFRSTVSKAAAILDSVTTLRDLLERFAATIGGAVGTDGVRIYIAQRQDRFLCQYSSAADGNETDFLPPVDILTSQLQARREPIILDELQRARPTAQTRLLEYRLEEMGAYAAFGIFTRENLVGVMLLGARNSGRIYGSMEQEAIQVLCGQLGVAIANAKLFTEVQNARIYNETLLQNLTTGVIAADADGRITVSNSEAERVSGICLNDGGRHLISELPPQLAQIIEQTLASGEAQSDNEVFLRAASGPIVARAGSSIFHDQDGELLGALMVVTDITDLKRMERQIRRSDRLASLGTLSAGMAHEIKNPLVSIKTFTQLLPERYDDSEFRDTFSNLISHEIDRIDSLVNQLLRFARPAKPLLRPMHVHEVLEKTLLLVQHRLYQREIRLTRRLDARLDTIRADADQLEQVFLNFFLNAMDAMKRGGELTVATQLRGGDILALDFEENGASQKEALSICICDTGEGIKDEDLAHVFDPFFTTKDYGTGLGLSVVHGIIQEHGGQVEVESELGKGTAFYIFLPIVHFEAEVAVA